MTRVHPQSPASQPAHVGTEEPPAFVEAADVVVRRMRSDASRGLSSDDAGERRRTFGWNELEAAESVPAWRLLLAQFENVLILILLVAIVLSLLLGETLEAAAIAAITVFSVVLGFVQEYRAERAIEALRRLSAPLATVVRDGEAAQIPSREVVPGDILLLAAGDVVSADARLIEAVHLQVNEAPLTGESVPVDKGVEPLADATAVLGDRTNLVFRSTAVTHGRGRAIVVTTAGHTEIGRIRTLLETVQATKTPLEQNLARIGRRLVQAALATVALVVLLGGARGLPWTEMIVFGIALAVAVVPEALPAVVTVSLAIGSQRMARRNALIRRLPTVETLGSTTVIGTDKTGTLTTGEMTVRELYVAGERISVTGAGYDPAGKLLQGDVPAEAPGALQEFLTAAALCTDAEMKRGEDGRWLAQGDPTEAALVVAAAKAGLAKADLEAAHPRVEEIAFCPERKRMTTLHARDGTQTAFGKGAPEEMLASCLRVRDAGGETPLDDSRRATILETAQDMAARSLRVLAVARKDGTSLADAETGMLFLGLAGLNDAPRPEAAEAIRTCHLAGIRPVMITGDHPLTAKAIATELGLLREGEIVTGAELAELDEGALDRRVDRIDVYARVSPADKLRVVEALQRRNHVVAMTGDGVNDAPALKRADIGIAMGVAGTDVAKEAASMTLTDDNFATIVAAIEEGRAILDNIRKYLMYLLSSNIGEIALMVAALLLGLPLPLSAVQILYVNLATDGLPALALAVDPHAPGLMRRPPRRPGSQILSPPIIVLMLIGGAWSAIVNVSLFAWALASGRPLPEAMSMAFISLVLIQFFKAYGFRSERESITNRPFANRWLNRAIGWEIVLLALILYVPALQAPFGTVSLPLADWVVLLPAALSIIPALEAGKSMVRRGWLGSVD